MTMVNEDASKMGQGSVTYWNDYRASDSYGSFFGAMKSVIANVFKGNGIANRPGGKELSVLIHKGARDYQEDAVLCDNVELENLSICVLADGMGGHAAGDVASQIVSKSVFEEIHTALASKTDDRNIANVLQAACQSANDKLREHVENQPSSAGMGSTLLAAVFFKNEMHWISVGDSPFYLYRNGALRQLNQDHSMARQIDQMAMFGLMSKDEARLHPDRNSLASALRGTPPEIIDVRHEPFELEAGDIFLVASDGLQTLNNKEIAKIVKRNKTQDSEIISNALLDSVLQKDDPKQDNISIVTVKISKE